MASRAIFTIRDYSEEVSTVSMPGVTVTNANFDAQAGFVGDLSDAIQDVVVGHLFEEKLVGLINQIAGAVTSPFAQRELKWLVTMREAGGTAHTVEIPSPDLQYLVAGSDLADMTAATMIALKAAIEAFYRFNGTVAVTVETIRLVGRNL